MRTHTPTSSDHPPGDMTLPTYQEAQYVNILIRASKLFASYADPQKAAKAMVSATKPKTGTKSRKSTKATDAEAKDA